MKSTLFVCLLLVSATTFAKDPLKGFQEELLKNVETEIKGDEESFKKPSRGPASVQEEKEPEFPSDQKIDRSVRQTGHDKW